MSISAVQFVRGLSGYFVKDLDAVRQTPHYNPLTTAIPPHTPGFQHIVQPGQVISIILHLVDGQIAIGDCVDVIFSGAASRDPLFLADDHLPLLETVVQPWLLSLDLSRFKENAIRLDGPWSEPGGAKARLKLHRAVQYGLSQALLSATALIHACTPAEIILREWGSTTISPRPVDILASCHRNDTLQLDRMIMKQAALLPHASFVHVGDVGPQAVALAEYVADVAQRVRERGSPGYHPRLHFDVYGTLGEVFSDDEDLVGFLRRLERVARPYDLYIESPVIERSKRAQIERLQRVRRLLGQDRECRVRLIADEWCNTLEDIREFVDAGAVDVVQIKMPDLGGVHRSIDAVLYCRSCGVGCCLGGSANETDVSARLTAHVAVATQPDFLLSKPGLGADEGLMILSNEMARTIAIVKRRYACSL